MTPALTSGSESRLGRLQDSHLFQAWLVLMLSIVFGACLAAVHINFSGMIAGNKLNESLERIPGLIWGETETMDPVENGEVLEITRGSIAVAKQDRTVFYPVFRVAHKGEVAGWVIKAAGQGYAGRIELLMGLDPGGIPLTGCLSWSRRKPRAWETRLPCLPGCINLRVIKPTPLFLW